jgi:hypothetical protein
MVYSFGLSRSGTMKATILPSFAAVAAHPVIVAGYVSINALLNFIIFFLKNF